MNNRIKIVLVDSKYTQVKFAKEIGISRTGLQKLITGENNPSEQTIRAICSVFKINRRWLETGEGEMHQRVSRHDELSAALDCALGEDNPARLAWLSLILRATPAELELLCEKARQLLSDIAFFENNRESEAQKKHHEP